MAIEWKPESRILIYSPTCAYCKRLHRDQLRSCDAFPANESIPLPIWQGENNHIAPYPGDNGIQFERMLASEE